eukprot:TRINITY_DN161_c0_g2_i7.p1 TRINITY_DN161_c0_g2~~TRINITY_DN161_c0_g2_i7.p1  ORF type:complete len:542 (-),score=43.56 TRINITY_DN161_c0_g2_i7:1013-2638(-)
MQNYAQTALNKMERQKSFYDVVKDKIVPKIDYQAIIDSGLAFNDEDFPPNVASLVSLAKSMHKPDKAFFLSEIVWAKANQMFGPYYELFGEISPSRIVQGRLGDCYFLSAVSALAEFPDRVKSIFVTREVNPSGCYALQVYISGYLRTMVVDDYIPCYPGTWKPAFTKSIGNELWVLLLEKAWAKVNDNYENIEEGDPEEALTFLTGAPSITLYSQDDDDGTDAIWQKILQADKNNYIICACAGEVPGTDPTDYEKVGIQSNHAYSLLAAKELQHHGKALRLLQLRNPWGAQDWVGDWSEVSPLWTEDLKRKVHYANKDRGAFFISFDDYVRYFSATVICKYHEDYCSQSFEVTQKAGQYLCFVFQIDTITLGYILVHQLEKRFMREKYKDYDYSPVSVLLAKVEADGSVKCIGEGAKKYRAKSIVDITLVPGKYILYVRVGWNQPYVNQYCVNMYTSSQVDMHKMDYCDEFPLVAEILKNYCREYKEFLKPMSPSFPFLQSRLKISLKQGFAYEYFVNLPGYVEMAEIECFANARCISYR